MTRRLYFALAALPLFLWGAAQWYLAQLKEMNAWAAAAPILLPIVGLSASLGLVGVGLTWRAWRRGEPLIAWVLATAIASLVALWLAVRILTR